MAKHSKRHNDTVSDMENTVFLKCPYCDFKTVHKRSINRHIMSQHSTLPPSPSQSPLLPNASETGHVEDRHAHISDINHSTVTQNVAHTNNYTINITPIIFPETLTAHTRVFLTSPEVQEKLIAMAKRGEFNSNNPEKLTEAVMSLFTDLKTLPFRKARGNTSYTEVHKGDHVWEKKHDDQVIPLVVKQSATDISCALEDASHELDRPPFKERLMKSADYVGGLADEVEDLEKSLPLAGSIEKREKSKSYRTTYRKTKAQLKEAARQAKEQQDT